MDKALKVLIFLLLALPLRAQVMQQAIVNAASSVVYTIAHDADGGPASNNCPTPSSSTTCTWSHTVGAGAHPILIVSTSWQGAAAGALISSVTCTTCNAGGAGTLTLAGKAGVQYDQADAAIYYFAGPSAGSTSITITMSIAPGAPQWTAGSTTYTGVNQTTPLDGSAVTSATSATTISNSITLAASNEWIVDCVSQLGSAGNIVRNSPQTQAWIHAAAFQQQGSSTYNSTGASGSISDGFTNGGTSTNWALVTIAIAPG